ncbi:MAG: hypothetical protein IJX33_10460 [Akkermansia sp.]|nr:hypothetical protein [Akkermansia sp.]MBQ8516484.1 hypothetical protein [Akkermansia sp.]
MIRLHQKSETTQATPPNIVFLCSDGFEYAYLIDLFGGKSLPELYVTKGTIGNSMLELWDFERVERIGILKKLQTRTIKNQHCNPRCEAILEAWHKKLQTAQTAQTAEKKDRFNTVSAVVLLLLLPLCGVLLGYYLATVTR